MQFFGLTGMSGIVSYRLSLLRVLQLVALSLFLLSVNVSAQELAAPEVEAAAEAAEEAAAEPAEPPQPKELKETDVADLDALIADIDSGIAHIDYLEERIAAEEGLVQNVLSVRLDRRWTKVLKAVVTLANKVSVKREGGFHTSAYDERVF